MSRRKNWKVSERMACVVEEVARRFRVSESWVVEAAFWRGIDGVVAELSGNSGGGERGGGDSVGGGDEFLRRVLFDPRFDVLWERAD